MRRYWMISLAIGGGAALVALALRFGGVFDGAFAWFWNTSLSSGWARSEGWGNLRYLEIPVIALFGVAVAWAVVEAPRTSQKLLIAALALPVTVLLSPVMALYGGQFDSLGPVVSVLMAASGGLLFARTELGGRKKFLIDSVGERVSPQIFDALLDSPLPPEFSGKTREVTTLVCRLLPEQGPEGSRSVSAEEVVRLGNAFCRVVVAFLRSRGAYVEEAGPEMVRGSFGMIRAEVDHAEKAALAALDLKGRMTGFALDWESRWFVPVRWGIGLESGSMAVGLCRSVEGVRVLGIGGEWERADRLALANARYGTDIVLGRDVLHRIGNRFETRPQELLYDPATRSLVEVHELLGTVGSLDDAARCRRDAFWRGVILLRQGDAAAALEELLKAKDAGVDDRALALLIARTQEGVAVPESPSRRLVREFTEDGQARLMQRL